MNLLPMLSAITLASGWIGAPDCNIRESLSFTQNANGDEAVASKNRTVCIDPGHPSEVNSGNAVQNGTTETHIDWAVAKKLQKLLVSKGFRVVMTKNHESQLVRNRNRAQIANRAKAGLMVRLHCDTGNDRGFALYYPDRTGTISGMTGPGENVRLQSRKAAENLAEAMEKELGGDLKSGGVRGDSKTFVGGKQGALTGSVFSKVPVVTIEMVTLSRSADAIFIKSEAGQNKMAQAIANGVESFLMRSSNK